MIDPSAFGMQPQVQHFSAPITNNQGQPIGAMEVRKESIPIAVAVSEGDGDEDDMKSLEQAKGELARCMLAMASLLHELQVQSHLIHLNYQGPNFLSVHKYLNGQYEAHLEQFDRVAEMLRSLDFYMPMCSKGLAAALEDPFVHCSSMNSTEMLANYLKNIETAGMRAKCVVDCAKAACAPDVENMAAELVESMFFNAYLIKSTLRPGTGG